MLGLSPPQPSILRANAPQVDLHNVENNRCAVYWGGINLVITSMTLVQMTWTVLAYPVIPKKCTGCSIDFASASSQQIVKDKNNSNANAKPTLKTIRLIKKFNSRHHPQILHNEVASKITNHHDGRTHNIISCVSNNKPTIFVI